MHCCLSVWMYGGWTIYKLTANEIVYWRWPCVAQGLQLRALTGETSVCVPPDFSLIHRAAKLCSCAPNNVTWKRNLEHPVHVLFGTASHYGDTASRMKVFFRTGWLPGQQVGRPGLFVENGEGWRWPIFAARCIFAAHLVSRHALQNARQVCLAIRSF